MYRLAYMLCTTLCAFNLTQAFADDVGFMHEQDISLSSPLDASDTSFPTEHSFLDKPSSIQSPHNLSEATIQPILKQVSVKPFTGKVKGKKVRVRSAADLDSPVIQELNKGDLLSIVAEHGDFWVVEPQRESKAYVFRSYIIDNVVEGNRVNVRLKPSVDSPVLTHLNSGDTISGAICQTNNKWMEIDPPSNLHFFVSKQFIENIGSPEVKLKHDTRRLSAKQRLHTAQHLGQLELSKNFQDIDFDAVVYSLQNIINEYPEFTDLTIAAKEELSLLQENYIDLRLSYAEAKVTEEQALVASNIASRSQLLTAITDKMKNWEPIEESLYLTWSNVNASRTLDEYYAEQQIVATEISGILEPYTAPVKCKPGDFIIRDKDLPVAYVYSTQINLQNLVGQKVTLKGTARPNNNFAFPAFFVLSEK
ncbi:MAG: SH3 domain-containing protein [Chlamydiia bacterium]|jgi:uncharacterized protein YgiM (DUF1202 family)